MWGWLRGFIDGGRWAGEGREGIKLAIQCPLLAGGKLLEPSWLRNRSMVIWGEETPIQHQTLGTWVDHIGMMHQNSSSSHEAASWYRSCLYGHGQEMGLLGGEEVREEGNPTARFLWRTKRRHRANVTVYSWKWWVKCTLSWFQVLIPPKNQWKTVWWAW